MFKSALKELAVAGLVEERRCPAAADCVVQMRVVPLGRMGAFRAALPAEVGCGRCYSSAPWWEWGQDDMPTCCLI